MQTDDAAGNLKPLLEDVIQAGPDLSKRRLCLAAMLREIVSEMTDDRTKSITPPLRDERPDPMGLKEIRETSRISKPKEQPRSPVPQAFHSVIAVLIDVMTSWEIESTNAPHQLEAEKLAEQVTSFVKKQTQKLEGQIQSLRQQTDKLRGVSNDVNRYKEELSKLRAKSQTDADTCEELRLERERLRNEVAQAEKEAAGIEQELKDSKKRLTSLKAKREPLSEVESQISKYEKEVTDLDSKLKPLEKKKRELAKHLSCSQQLVETLSDYSLGHSPAAKRITEIWNEIPSDEFEKLLQCSDLHTGQRK